MAACRAVVTMATSVLLMSILLGVAVGAGGEISGDATRTLGNHHHNNNNHTKTIPSHLHFRRHRPPVADPLDANTETYDTPLEVPTSHHHAAKPSRSNKVHTHGKSQSVKSGHIQKVDSRGSKKTKSKVTLRRIRRVLEELIDEPMQTAPKTTETNTTPLVNTRSNRHGLKSLESTKEHKHVTGETKTGRIRKEPSLENSNNTLAKHPKTSHKKSVHVSEQGLVMGEKKLKRGRSRVVPFEERPLCKPHESTTMTTTRSFIEHQDKSQRILDSYKKPELRRQDVLTFFGLVKSKPTVKKQKQENQKSSHETEESHVRGSLSGHLNKGNRSEGNWAPNRFILKNAHSSMLNKVKRCAECGKNEGFTLLTVGLGTENHMEVITAVNTTENSSMDRVVETPAKLRVKKSVGSTPNENLTADWDGDNDDVTISGENAHNDIRQCIPTQTFALGLICMSVILSICFLLLWRKTDQPEKMYALAYIVACIIYVVLALVYLATKSADYIRTQPAQK